MRRYVKNASFASTFRLPCRTTNWDPRGAARGANLDIHVAEAYELRCVPAQRESSCKVELNQRALQAGVDAVADRKAVLTRKRITISSSAPRINPWSGM